MTADPSIGTRVDITELRRLYDEREDFAEAWQSWVVAMVRNLPSLLDELAASRQATHEVTEAARALLRSLAIDLPSLPDDVSEWLSEELEPLRAVLEATDG